MIERQPKGELMKTNVIYNKDCLEVLKDIPDESVDCVITDCPYRIISGGCTSGASDNPGGVLNHDLSKFVKRSEGGYINTEMHHVNLVGIFDEFDQTIYSREGKLFKYNYIEFCEWLPEVYRVLKKGTHCYIMVNPRNLAQLQTEAEKVGFEFQQLLIWDKGNATPNRYYLNAFECILMLSKRPARNINDMGAKNIISVPNIIGNKEHPTEKPVELMKFLIRQSTSVGEIVVDPFMGSGTTCVASALLKREYIGIDIDEKYYNIAYRRLNDDKHQTSIFDI